MTRLLSELAMSGVPVWLITGVLFVLSLAVLIRAIAGARAEVVRAHGESDRTVTVFESNLRHKRWRQQRRDRRRDRGRRGS
jgi:hypothetical protein